MISRTILFHVYCLQKMSRNINYVNQLLIMKRGKMQWQIQDFPKGEDPNPWAGGANLIFCPIFTENCMKMKTLGEGGSSLIPPLESASEIM